MDKEIRTYCILAIGSFILARYDGPISVKKRVGIFTVYTY